MSIFTRNCSREGMMPRGSNGQWYSATLANFICLHVYTEDGAKWKTKTVGAATFEGSGYDSREEAERSLLLNTRNRLLTALDDMEESEASDG